MCLSKASMCLSDLTKNGGRPLRNDLFPIFIQQPGYPTSFDTCFILKALLLCVLYRQCLLGVGWSADAMRLFLVCVINNSNCLRVFLQCTLMWQEKNQDYFHKVLL